MKKLLALLLVMLVCFSFYACGDKEEDTSVSEEGTEAVATVENENNEENEDSSAADVIDLSVDKGSIKYVGYEKASEELLDEENVIIIKFEYASNQDLPAQCQTVFQIQTFQNGVETDNPSSYHSSKDETGARQYDLVNNYFLEVMRGGKITFGRFVQLTDDSPITIIVKEKANKDNYQIMEVDISAPSSDDSSATVPVDETEEQPVVAPTTVATTEAPTTEQHVWSLNYYVDNFNQPTDEWFIANDNYFVGTFNNSATTNSKLTATMLIDFEKDIAFFLYEYGRSAVKNSSQNYVVEYDITMRTADGTDHNMSGTMYCGDDRIYIDDEYRSEVLKALQGDGDVMFYFENAERNVENYLLTVKTANFADEYASVVG